LTTRLTAAARRAADISHELGEQCELAAAIENGVGSPSKQP